MIKFKNTKLSKKEIKTLNIVLDELPDSFRDFYTTQNNIRLFLQDNKELISNAVAKGDYLIYDTEEKGLLLVTGYSDNFKRKYIKILAENNAIIYNLLERLMWDIKEDLFIKVNKRNPIIKILQEFNFVFCGGRGKQILLKRSK